MSNQTCPAFFPNVNVTTAIGAFLTAMSGGIARLGPAIAQWTQYGLDACTRRGISPAMAEKVLERGGRVFFDPDNGRFNLFSRELQVVIDEAGNIVSVIARDAPRILDPRYIEITFR